jgi:hypothetical protein
VAHFPPVRPTAPGAILDSAPGAQRRPRRTWLALLLGAGAVILLAGLIWGIAAGKSRAGPSPAAQAQASQQAQYRASGVQVVPRPRGAVVRWSPPHAAGVVAFIVLAELGGRAPQEHTVGATGHGAVFAGLRSGRRYCFVVGTVVESAGGQAGTATAPGVCRIIR